ELPHRLHPDRRRIRRRPCAMRLATRNNGTPDGELVVVSADGERCLAAGTEWPNLLSAIENWEIAKRALRRIAAELDDGAGEGFEIRDLRAPMPRSWQWLDGSAFETHAKLMEVAFG